MDREIQELLHDLQKFTNTAVEKLQKGARVSSAFYFNLAASISGKLSDKVNPEK